MEPRHPLRAPRPPSLLGANARMPSAKREAGRTRDVLAASRVDVFGLIHEGIAPRAWVPGAHGLFAAGKRHHIAADGKTGKSLAIGVVQAIDTALAGGRVVVLDRENGGEEYARRLDQVMTSRGLDEQQRARIEERLTYHAWPAVRLELGDDDDYADAFDAADLV